MVVSGMVNVCMTPSTRRILSPTKCRAFSLLFASNRTA